MMSGIRGKDTQPELVLRKGLFLRGVRFRLHAASLPGRPDLVIRRRNAVVLVHGCFWHAHEGCRFFRVPEQNREFWVEKLGRNRERDTIAVQKLREAGWRVAVVWECATRADAGAAVDALHEFLVGDRRYVEIAGSRTAGRLTIRSRTPRARSKALAVDD
jgi:DNA mismatch endonuclease (patch repair protein)